MTTCIGETIVLKGHLGAAEDIRIAGRIEGDIHVQEHVNGRLETAFPASALAGFADVGISEHTREVCDALRPQQAHSESRRF
jgi:hypothetical protein